MNRSQIEEFQWRLLTLQARVRGDVKHLTDGALGHKNRAGDQRSPTHIAELGTDAYEQDFSLRFAESDQEVLQEIQSALGRIEDGTFGVCESCMTEGKSRSRAMIKVARLRAIPYARNCIECERNREQLTL